MPARPIGQPARVRWFRRTDRRLASGEPLIDALLVADRPLSFEELSRAAMDCDTLEVSAWLGHAVEARFVDQVPGPGGEHRYQLRPRGKQVLLAGRRRTPTRRGTPASA